MAKEPEILNFFDVPIEHFPDRSVRWLFQDSDNIRGLLGIVDPKLEERIDFGQTTHISRSFILDNLQERESDVVVSVPFRNESETDDLLIYILVEHQSTIDSTMGFRILFYMTQIWDSQRREWEAGNVPRSEWRFRPILPIVFYTGDHSWNAPLSLDEIISAPDALSRFIPKFDTLFLSVKETDEANLTKTGHPLGWLLTALQQEKATKERLRRTLIEAMSRVNALDHKQAGQRQRAIAYLLLLILHRRPVEEHNELKTLVDRHIQHPEDKKEVANMTQTMAQHLIERGKAQGRELGREEGRELGAAQAKQAAVLKLLRSRFVSVPESVIDQITLIRDLSRLDSLFEESLNAETLDEIELQNHDS